MTSTGHTWGRTWKYQVRVAVQWFLHRSRGRSGFSNCWGKQTARLKLCLPGCGHPRQRRKLGELRTNRPCGQSAAAIRRESDLSFVAVQGAHGLLDGRALHRAAVHAEHCKGQTEAPFTTTFTSTLSPQMKHWLLTSFCSVLASLNPVLTLAVFYFLFQSTIENCTMSKVFCARKAGDHEILKS